jgi:hypothetical protein
VDRDGLIRAGLYDPAAPEPGERLELLEYLAAEGLTIEEMAEADREGRLTVAAVERMLRGGTERLTLAEVCQRAGVDTEIARGITRRNSSLAVLRPVRGRFGRHSKGNGVWTHHGRSSSWTDVTHLIHHGPRRPGATRRTGAP